MKKILKSVKGSFAVEAIGSLVIFIYGFISILYFANVAQTEAMIQHALNQTAKELSQYVYVGQEVLSKMEISNPGETVDQVVDYMTDLAIGRLDADANEGNGAEGVDIIKQYIVDPIKGKIKEQVILQSVKFAMIKYISSAGNYDEAHKSLLNNNIVDGLDGLSFEGTSLLRDGKDIFLVVEYEIEPPFWRLFNKTLEIKQATATGVWIERRNGEVDEFDNEKSKWHLPPLERGRAFLKEVRENNFSQAVKTGHGVDLYEEGVCKFYFSLNLYSAHYSKLNGEEGTYTLNQSNLSAQLRTYRQKIELALSKLNTTIEMEDGRIVLLGNIRLSPELHIIVPEEGEEFIDELKKISYRIEEESGIIIKWHFQEKYLS